MRFEDLGMERVGGSLHVPTEAFAQWVARMDTPATLAEGLWLLAGDPSPAGTADNARHTARLNPPLRGRPTTVSTPGKPRHSARAGTARQQQGEPCLTRHQRGGAGGGRLW